MPFVTKARRQNDPTLRKPNAGLNKAEKQIYNIYLRALEDMRIDLNDANVMRALREAIEAGNPGDASVAFRWAEFVTRLQNSVPALANQVATNANISAKKLPRKMQYETSFTATDLRAIAWAQQRAGARIQGITQESQKAVADVISNGLRTKLTRDEVIAQITEIVGLDRRQARALANMYEKTLLDLLEDGETYESARRKALSQANDYRRRLLVQRATRIARTETLAAANAGRMLSWQEAGAQGLLPPGSVKRWKTATDERTCVVCAPLHNDDVAWDTVFSTGDMMPPAHPNCRCTAVIVPGEPVFTQNLEKSVEKRYYRFADGEETWRNYDYRWRKMSTELRRKVGKCQRCGSKSDLTVDHKKRLKDGGAKYDRKNLRVLCRSCNGKLARLGTKLRKDSGSWLLAKHAPGKHDQKTHAGGGGGKYQASAGAMLAFNDANLRMIDDWNEEDDFKTTLTYIDKYSGNTNEDIPRAVERYATQGYEDINGLSRDPERFIAERRLDSAQYTRIQDQIATIDKAIEDSPDVFNDTNLYRVFSDRLISDLQPGDTFIDKGFMSTTRANITKNRQMRLDLGAISPSDDTVAVILPSPTKSGKGLAVDWLLTSHMAQGYDSFGEIWGREKEVLLPRGTELLFLGLADTTDSEGKAIAIFQRMDK